MRTLLLTGFEPFLDVPLNPSGEVARQLDGACLEDSRGGDLAVHGRVLPVAFELGQGVAAVVSLGVHRGPAFRLEQRARAVFQSGQPDNDGQVGGGVPLEGPAERHTSLDLDRCELWLRAAGAEEVSRSDDAGGYLCERIYRAGLDAASTRGFSALFLHVPPVEHLRVEAQVDVVRGFLAAFAREL